MQTKQDKRAVKLAREARKAEYIRARKDVPCMDCGQRFPHYCMDYHHRDEETKDERLKTSRVGMVERMKTWKHERIDAEIDKCDILCACCHRKRHFEP